MPATAVSTVYYESAGVSFLLTAAHNDQINSFKTGRQHGLTLALFVFWIFADNSDAAFSFNNFAFIANWFY